jgi:hypothetical protein
MGIYRSALVQMFFVQALGLEPRRRKYFQQQQTLTTWFSSCAAKKDNALCRLEVNLPHLKSFKEARDNLLHNVSDMELKVTKSSNVEGKNGTSKKKCRHTVK